MVRQSIGLDVNIEVAKRKFVPDPNGKTIAPDGQRGYYTEWERQYVHNLLTNDGRDFLHQQGYETSSLSTNGANYIAVSDDGTAPADTDSSLTGEITSGGLSRAQGTVTHVAGNTTTQIENTFTASASHTNVQKTALFTAGSGGTMVNEATFNGANLENNDQLKVIWTITLND